MGSARYSVASAVLLLTLSQGMADQDASGPPTSELPDAVLAEEQTSPPEAEVQPPENMPKPLSVYLALDGAASGPYDRHALLDLRDSHRIWPDTQMWMEGHDAWGAMRETAAVADALWSADAPSDPKAMAWLAGHWESLPYVYQMPGKGQAQSFSLLTIEPFGWLEMFNKKVQLNTVSPSIEIVEYSGKATAVYSTPTTLLLHSEGTHSPVVDGKMMEPEKGDMTVKFTVLGLSRMVDVFGVGYRRVE